MFFISLVFTAQMRFATVALMGAIGIIDLIEGRRNVGNTESYSVTRAICDGTPYTDPNNTRRLQTLSGETRLSQVSAGANAGDIRVWSHWYNVNQSDSYSLSIWFDIDCAGTESSYTLQN